MFYDVKNNWLYEKADQHKPDKKGRFLLTADG
jgi:hypothetical protein